MNKQKAPAAVSAAGLRKSFGDKIVLDGIDLTVPEGTIFALLGPNGAGKTTMVQILSTLIAADGGEARIGGHDLATEPDAVRTAIGVTGQFSAVDNLLTGEENLILMADLRHLGRREGRRRAAELLDRFDLVEAARKTAATYSGGMRRRLDLAMTLVGDPRIIFLDEPTTGLDPRSRRTMWQIIRDLVAGGVTIFLTTQYLEEADQLADRIAVLDHGQAGRRGDRGRAQAPHPRRATSGCGSPARTNSNPPPAPSARYRATTTRSRCRSRATAACHPCEPCSTGLRTNQSTSMPCPSIPPISTMFSSPSPATASPVRGRSAMSTRAHAVSDSATMLRRNLRHALRYPSMSVSVVAMPVIFLLLFVYVFGGTLGPAFAARRAAAGTSTTSSPASSC